MRVVRGSFQGTGAALYLGIGFIPKQFRMWNISDGTVLYQLHDWTKDMRRTIKGFDGHSMLGQADMADGNASDVASGSGVSIYRGGDVGNGTETYLIADPEPDKRAKGAGVAIDTWTLGSSTNKTGNWNDVCSLTYPNTCGVGSLIVIDGKEYTVYAITSNGEQANEVTLDAAAPNGRIGFLGGLYTHVQCPATLTMPPGMYIPETAAFNVDGEMVIFEAYDE